jgi:hypothetical protein
VTLRPWQKTANVMSRECRYDSSLTWVVTHVQPSHWSAAGCPGHHIK